MITTTTEPIPRQWTSDLPAARGGNASAAVVNSLLASIEVAELGSDVVPYLAAAAAELALLAAIPWRFSADDPPVALLRMIAKVALRHPDVGGPHTSRLFEQLA